MFSVAKFAKYALVGLAILAALQFLFRYMQHGERQLDLFSSVTRAQWNKIAIGALAIVAGGPWLLSTWKKQAVLPSWQAMVVWRRSDVPRAKAPAAFWFNVLTFGLIVLWGLLEIASAFVRLPFPALWPLA